MFKKIIYHGLGGLCLSLSLATHVQAEIDASRSLFITDKNILNQFYTR